MKKAGEDLSVSKISGKGEANDVYVMTMKNGLKLKLLGASFTTGIDRNVDMDFMMFKLPPTKGIIILHGISVCFVKVDPAAKEPFDLSLHMLEPFEGRIFHILGSEIEVVIGDDTFTTNRAYDRQTAKDKIYCSHVLLCQYIFGIIGPDELMEAVASKSVQEKLKDLELTVESLRRSLKLEGVEKQALNRELSKLDKEIQLVRGARDSFSSGIVRLEDVINRALSYTSDEWGSRKKNLTIIKNILSGKSKPEISVEVK